MEIMETQNSCGCSLVIDFDSTFVKLEALEELAEIALQDNPQKEQIVEEIKKITDLGMEGKITFPQSLGRRLKLFSSEDRHVQLLIEKLKKNISDSVVACKDFFLENADNIYIISGGFEDFIYPVVEEYGIKKDHILANKFVFDEEGKVVGIDEDRPLAQEGGKAKAVKLMELGQPVCVVGDGWTDYEIKQAGCADIFCAFCENVKRDVVVESADHVFGSFHDVVSWANSPAAQSYN